MVTALLDARRARHIAERVPDPELPMLTLADLGVLRDVEVGGDGTVVVSLTPTYSGCPAMAEMRASNGRLTPAWYAGLAVPFYCAWVLTSLTGAMLGALLGDPKVIGLDFAFPAVFIILVMGFWKGRETGAVLAASACAAVVTHQLLPGVWYIAAGAAAGVVVAVLSGGRKEAHA